jgi:hypothetical protein
MTVLADCRSSANSNKRPLRIGEPPISAADRSTVDAPMRKFDLA